MKYIDTKKKPLFFKFLRKLIRVFYHKRTFYGLQNLPDEPSLIISNHAQMNGPLTSEMFFPAKKYIWCIGQMMKLKEVPAYAYTDFWSLKSKYTRWIYKIVSYLIAPIASYVFNRADTIAVYKDARVIHTYRETITKLEEGANIIIFPECSTEYNHIINEFQDKFVDTARFYYKKTGKTLSFVPMYNAAKLKKVVIGKPIKYNPNIPIDEQRKIICDYLKEEITNLALELPVHRVVPYSNIKRRAYQKSK